MTYTEQFTDSTGQNRVLELRFHRESRLRYRAESADALFAENNKLLKKFVDHHRNYQYPRIRELYDYAEGNNHEVLRSQRRKDSDMADNRAVHNFGKLVSTFKQGYLLGVPVEVSYDDQADESVIDAKLREIGLLDNFHQLNRSLVLDMSQVGRAYDLVYRSQEDKTKAVRLDPLETFVIYDTTSENHVVAAVRYYQANIFDTKSVTVEVYTETEIITFNATKEDYKETSRSNHKFRQVPVTEYFNNSKGIGDYETELSLIDLYDSAESDTANYMNDLADAILFLFGNIELPIGSVDEQIEFLAKMKQARFMHIKPPIDTDGNEGSVSAEYLSKSYDVEGTEAYKTRLQKDIHKFTNTPDMSDQNFAGSQTGVAMKWKIFGLEQERIDTQAAFETSLRRRYQLIANVGEFVKEIDGFDISKLRIKFTPNLPADTDGLANYIKALYGIVSDRTIFELTHGLTEVSVDDEIKRLKEQEALEQPEPRLEPVNEVVEDEQEIESKPS